MAGLASAFQSTLKQAPERELSAVWLEYEIRVPGEAPRRIRRTVFDFVGPARRASRTRALHMDDDKRFARGLALMMRTELLPIASGLSPEFLQHLVNESVLGNRQLLRDAMRGALPSDVLTQDSLLSHGAPFVSPLYTLAVARLQWSRDAGKIYIDRPDLLTRHMYSAPSGSMIEFRDATDIVANEIGVSLDAGDARRVRLAEGVLETNAESMLRMTTVRSNNAGDAYNSSHDWVAIGPRDTASAATPSSRTTSASASMMSSRTVTSSSPRGHRSACLWSRSPGGGPPIP